MIELDNNSQPGAKIRVIGIGGGGGNAINNMILKNLIGVDFIAANTDRQALDHNLAQVKVQIGRESTRGLGAGADPEVGKKATEESLEEIKEILKGSDMIFITGGMGGGTGTGGAPIIAQIGKDLGSLIVAIVTKPFSWEGRKRSVVAELGISELRKHVDALIVIPNQKLLDIIDKSTSFNEAFLKVDEVLYNATRGIADIISNHGYVNVDFADVKTIMKGMGDALMGIGIARGQNRAVEATQNALNSPLLDGISINGAKGVLVNVTGGTDMSMHEIAEVISTVESATGSDVNLIHGVVYNPELSEELMVTVVATGFNGVNSKAIQENVEKKADVSTLFGEKSTKPDTANTVPVGNFPTRPSVLSPKGRIPVSESYSPNEKYSSPKGPDALKMYDAPAFERRNGKESLNAFGKNVSVIEKISEETEAETDGYIASDYTRPAFIRKIMD